MSRPRTTRPRGDLVAYWSFKENDLMFDWDKHPPDGHLLYGAFCYGSPSYSSICKALRAGLPAQSAEPELSFVKELERRGFDITTLKFSIKRKR